MGIDIIPAVFCADYWSTFDVPGSKGKVWQVDWVGGEGPAYCNCPAFKYSKETPQTCKHLDEVFKKGCFWNPQWCDGNTKEMRPRPDSCSRSTVIGEKCPHCGGPVVAVRIAV